MKTVQTSIETQRSPGEVYAYLVDFANHPEWRFDVLESELVHGETGRVGARYRQRVKQGPREMTVNAELTKAEPARAIAFRTVDSGRMTASGTYDIQPAGQGTAVVVDVVIEARGFMRLFEPMMGPTLRKTAERYEQDLGRRLG